MVSGEEETSTESGKGERGFPASGGRAEVWGHDLGRRLGAWAEELRLAR